MKNLRWVILALFIVICMSFAASEIQFPELKQRVNDFTNTLSFQEWQEVDRLLKSYEDTASTQVVVLMVNSIEGVSLEEFAQKTFALNKIGQAEKDNGALLLIVKQDHKVRIETGRGLEGALTGAASSQIIRNEILPYLKAENYFGGIVTGADAIVRAAAGNYQLNRDNNITLLIVIVVAAILIIAVGMLVLKKKKSR